MTTPAKSELLDFLRSSQLKVAAKAPLKRTLQQFVLDYGWWYEPAEFATKMATGTPNQCHTNAVALMHADHSLFYCEGYALFQSGTDPTIHAWATDGQGRAIDNTWPQPGVAYAGVPFRSLYVNMTALKNRAILSLLNNYQNNYPLRGDLGDRPDEWLDLRGQGMKRLVDAPATNEV
jgi:hypothetical protein